MSKCKICGCDLTEKRMDLTQIFNAEEKERLSKIRKERQVCSECALTLTLLNLI